MAVFYKLYQMMEGKTGVKGMWRVHVVPQGKVDIDGLAKIMEKNSTVKASDIKAVLYELVDAMQRHLLNGDRVVVDGFGAFKVNIKSKGVDALTDFKVVKSAGDLLDAEALRVAKLLPKFTPGKEKGQPVSVRYTFPVAFRLK